MILRVDVDNPANVTTVVTGLCYPEDGEAKGNKIYFVDTGSFCLQPSRIIRFNLNGTGVETVFSSTTIYPEGLSFDGSGNLFFNTRDGHDGAVWMIPGGQPGATAVPATAAQAPFGEGTHVDQVGRLYQIVAGFVNVSFSKILRFEPPFSSSNTGTVFKNLAGQAPVGIVEKDNILYVSNFFGNIFRFDLDGNQLSDFTAGLMPPLTTPFFMEFDGSGNLYVTEHHAGRVRKVAPNGVTNSILIMGLASVDNGPVGLAYAEGPDCNKNGVPDPDEPTQTLAFKVQCPSPPGPCADGTKWSFLIDWEGADFTGDCGPVPVGGNPPDLAAEFASCISDAIDAVSGGACSGISITQPGGGAVFRVTVPGTAPLQICVGPEGGPPNDCCVADANDRCSFNPDLVLLPLSGQDCNRNGVDDGIDIGLETSADVNENGIPDECEFKPIPTFSTWGLVGTVLALIAGMILYGRRRWARR